MKRDTIFKSNRNCYKRASTCLRSYSNGEIEDDVSGDEFAERIKFLNLLNRNKNHDESAAKEQEWLSWLKQGKSPVRGVADIKLRDAAALGAIPRADRYASR